MHHTREKKSKETNAPAPPAPHLAQQVVVLDKHALALVDRNVDALLVVLGRRKHLALGDGQGRVALDERGHDTTGGFQTERKRRDIQQEEFGELFGLVGTRQNGGLDRGTKGDSLIGIDVLARLLAVEEFAQQLLHLRNSGGSSY